MPTRAAVLRSCATFGWCAASLLLASAPLPAWADQPTPAFPPPIVRFQQVDDGLYRGGQPDAEAFAQLQRLGIKTIVNLRRNDAEQAMVEALGLRYVDLATGLTPFGMGPGISSTTIERFFEIVDEASNRPIFLHCRRGADRTGALIAMYRIARQGWTASAAYDEARALGMRWWHFPVRWQLEDFAERWRQEPPLPAGEGW